VWGGWEGRADVQNQTKHSEKKKFRGEEISAKCRKGGVLTGWWGPLGRARGGDIKKKEGRGENLKTKKKTHEIRTVMGRKREATV